MSFLAAMPQEFVQGNSDVGGILGLNAGTISSSYTTARVQGESNAGAFIGRNTDDQSANQVRDNYYNSQTAGIQSDVGYGSNNGIIALTTAELQALTADNSGFSTNHFDFGTNSQYPALRSYLLENYQQIQGILLCNQPSPRAQCNDEPIPPTPTLPVTTLVDANNNGLFDIYYIEDLDAVRNDSAANYELLRSLDFTDPNSYRSGVVNADFIPNVEDPSQATNPGFTPIDRILRNL